MNMKKIIASIILAAAVVTSFAQNNQGKMDDMGRIALTPVILENSYIPAAASNVVLNKLTQIVTQNGLAGDSFDPRFIITANMVELSHDVSATTPPMQAYTLSPTLYIGDAATGTLYATCALNPIKGAGTNATKAYMQAVKMLKANSPEVQRFIETGKTRIIEWYNTQIDFLISEANALAGQDKYDASPSAARTSGTPRFCSLSPTSTTRRRSSRAPRSSSTSTRPTRTTTPSSTWTTRATSTSSPRATAGRAPRASPAARNRTTSRRSR